MPAADLHADITADGLYAALKGELDRASVTDLWAQLEPERSLCEIDLSGVTRCDSAGLQLLLHLQRRQPDLVLRAPSASLVDLAALFGASGIMTP